jgi:hypothetical protein
MIAPSARMMLLEPPYAGKRLRKLRFLMTDNKNDVEIKIGPLGGSAQLGTWIMHTISGRSMARLAEAGRV